jgi:hypothetical protein
VATTPAPAPAAVITSTEPSPTLTPTGRSTVAVATPLEVTTFAPTIRSATMANRDQMLSDIESRVKASEQALSSMHSTMSQMSEDGRKAFNSASDEVKAKAKALRATLKKARNASEQEWDSLRTQLASDYEAYATSVGRVDVSTGTSAR